MRYLFMVDSAFSNHTLIKTYLMVTKKKERSMAKRERRQERENLAKQLLALFLQRDDDLEIATAEVIKTLNKWIKREDVSVGARNEGYKIKDAWITLNKPHVSEVKTSEVFGFQDTYRELYAYQFDIKGRLYRFHSFLKLFPGVKVDKETYGSAEPLSNKEVSQLGGDLFVLLHLARLLLNKESGIFEKI